MFIHNVTYFASIRRKHTGRKNGNGSAAGRSLRRPFRRRHLFPTSYISAGLSVTILFLTVFLPVFLSGGGVTAGSGGNSVRYISGAALPFPTARGALPVPSAVKKWTVIVYLDADNNLERFGISDVNEMEAGLTDDTNVNVLVLVDLKSTHRTDIYYISHDTNTTLITSSAVRLQSELNMGDPATLTSFLNFAATYYPAEHYWLDLWDHGGNFIGVCWDDTDGEDRLDLSELKTALTSSSIGHFDLISMDACLMGSLEVSYTLRDICDYYVASPETIPGHGFPYDTIIGALVSNPSMDGAALGTVLVDKYFEFYSGGNARAETLALYNMSRAANIMGAVDGLADAFTDLLNSGGGTRGINDAWWLTEYYTSIEWLDLYDFAAHTKAEFGSGYTAIYGNATAVQNAVSDYVIYSKANPGHPNSHGISFYFPVLNASIRPSYLRTDFVKDSRWDEFLSLYYSKGGGGTLSFAGMEINDTSDGNGNGIPEPGERVSLDIKLYNGGLVPIPSPVNATLTVSSGFISVVSGFSEYSAPVAVGYTVSPSTPFVMDINSSAPSGALITLTLRIKTLYGDYNETVVIMIGSVNATGGDSFDTAAPLGLPSTAVGSLPGPGRKGELYFKIELDSDSAPVDLTAVIEHGPSADFDMDLYDSNYGLLASAFSTNSPDSLTAYLKSPGTYYLVIYPYNYLSDPTNAGNFTLCISSSEPSFKRGESMQYSIFMKTESVHGYLPGPSPFGSIFYRLYLEKGREYTVILNSSDPNNDFDLFIYDSSGSEIAYSNNKGTNETVTFKANYTGSYYIEVWRYSGEGDFVLTVPGYGTSPGIDPMLILILVIVIIIFLLVMWRMGKLGTALQCCLGCLVLAGRRKEGGGTEEGGGEAEEEESAPSGAGAKFRLCRKCKARLGKNQTVCPKCGTYNPLP